MVLLQHYYTSYKNETTGRAGWQTLAMSRGITPELDVTIQGLIGYKAPQSLASDDLASHPVALRYMYEASHRGFLLCSQSTGLDNQNRPGNFFAHTLVIPPENFDALTLFPPILCWKSPLWCREDRGQRAELPTLEIYDLEEGLAIQDIWDFLAQGKRRAMLYQLFCALVHRKRISRRIVILDANRNVALWIAALSLLLPPAYRPFLSFATYHHAPLEQRYLLTGTTRDWWQRVSGQAQAQAFFVLDAENEGRNNALEDSCYAQLVTSLRSFDDFNQQLVPLFAQYARRFPPQGEIDEQLELLALYINLLKRTDAADLSTQEFLALNRALDSFAEEAGCAGDGAELRCAQTMLLRLANQQELRVKQALGRVQTLLAQRGDSGLLTGNA